MCLPPATGGAEPIQWRSTRVVMILAAAKRLLFEQNAMVAGVPARLCRN